MVLRPWVRAILKVVVIGATMCSGIIVAKNDPLYGMRGTKEDGVLGSPNRT